MGSKTSRAGAVSPSVAVRRRVLVLAAVATVSIALGPSAAARAQTAGSTASDPDVLTVPAAADRAPLGRTRTARAMIAAAERTATARRIRREERDVTVRAFLRGEDAWQVSFYTPRKGRENLEVAQILLSDRTGRVQEAWTGIQIDWTMARGYAGAFGRRANNPVIWVALCLLFVAPFLRGPPRMLHLDLAVLLSFSLSYALFGAAEIAWSVPTAYPPLLYLLVRMLALARARGREGGREALPPLALRVGPEFLAIAIVFLLGFRLGLNITSSNVIDVGYAGVIGADRLVGGEELYGNFPSDNEHGDTYGPVNYMAYVPFELIWPWRGTWDSLPAAHAASITFDVLCCLVLWLLGRRLRGPQLGLLLAFLWLAFPFSLLVASSNSNDTLVPLLVLGALLVASKPVARGATLALAGLAKFAPLAVAPILATYRPVDATDRADGEGRVDVRSIPLTVLGFAGAAAVVLTPVVIAEGGLLDFWERSVGFQAGRDSPFSVWGYFDLGGPQVLVGIAAIALSIVVAFVPRRRDLVSLAALAAAVLIALQLGVSHWFYLYIVWFAPLVLVALLARHAEPEGELNPAD